MKSRLGGKMGASISRECGQCSNSYTFTEQALKKIDSFLECPHCGDKTAKRKSYKRERKVTTLFLRVGKRFTEAATVDVSEGGAQIFYLGKPIPVDTEVSIEIEALSIRKKKAVVVWSHRAAKTYSHTGIKYIDG